MYFTTVLLAPHVGVRTTLQTYEILIALNNKYTNKKTRYIAQIGALHTNIRGMWRRQQRGRLVYGGSDSSIEGETHLQRRGLVYRGQDLYTEVETCLRRGKLVYGGGGLWTKG